MLFIHVTSPLLLRLIRRIVFMLGNGSLWMPNIKIQQAERE
jgi:hypothetical protein